MVDFKGGIEAIFVTRHPSIGPVQLNMTISETHMREWEASMVPVESGAILTDHIQQMPKSLTIDGVISPRPGTIAEQDLLGNFSGGSSSHDQYQTSWARLNALGQPPYTPFDVYTALEPLENMILISLERIEAGDEWMRFTAELRQIEEVGIRRDKFLSEDLVDRGQPGLQLGETQTKEVEAGIEEASTFLENIFGAF